jgi:hypothetical protein
VLAKRFGRYGLEVQEAKSRLLNFSRPIEKGQKPEVFDSLGSSHFWGKSRKGNRVVKCKTSGKKLRKAIKRVYLWCGENRHMPGKEQWAVFCRKLHGHYGYYGITGNIRSLKGYSRQTKRAWQKWLNRRSRQKDMPWDRFNRLLERYPLPSPRIVHQYS